MENMSPSDNQAPPFKTKSLLAFWMGIAAVFLLIALMIASMIVGGTGSFEEGYERGQSLGWIWSTYVFGSMIGSFILSIIAIVIGSMAAKKENLQYKTFAIIGIVLGSIGLSLFLCCSALVVLGLIAAASRGM